MNVVKRGVFFALLVSAGCAGPIIDVNGIEVYESHWNGTQEELRERARYELSCEHLQFRLIRKVGRHPTEVGVQGCGRRVVYLRRHDFRGWVLNSDTSALTAGDGAGTADFLDPPRRTTRSPEVRTAEDGERLVGVETMFFALRAEIIFRFAPSLSPQVRVAVASSTAVPFAQCENLEIGRGARILFSTPLDEERIAMVDRGALFEAMADASYVQFCGRSWVLNARDASGLRHFQALTEEILASADAAPAEPVSDERREPTSDAPATSVADQVRSRLDAAKALIEACVGQASPVGVEAEWDEAGVVRASVRGESDAAVGACVTAALGEWRVSADGPGRVIHVVQ